MQTKVSGLLIAGAGVWLLGGCPGDDTGAEGTETSPASDTGTGSETDSADSGSGSGSGGECVPSDQGVPPLDLSGCAPSDNDYQPTVNGSADDMWPACVNDDGSYTPIELPSTAARVEAWEMIRTIFAAGTTPDDFTAAREQYTLAEGIESRVVRREDVHYPNIPADQQDDTISFDRQCTIEANVMNFPDRCAGPAKVAPIINDAFVAGQMGMGDPAVNAARIDAAIGWFMYLSVIKEPTFSCPKADKGGDCDSGWAYYNGATDRGSPLGYGADVLAVSPETNERIFDGIAAMRCWRDTYPPEMDADETDAFYGYGYDQIDRANNHGAVAVLRDRLSQQLMCSADADANWAWIQVFGQTIIKPAQDIDAGRAATWEGLIANPAPSAQEILDGASALDFLFPCP